MPLKHGKSEKSFKENIKTEMEHGKPQKQAIAIAYAVRRKAQHKAKGGLIPGVEHPHKGEPMNKKLHPCAHGGPVHCKMGCYAEGGEVKKGIGEKIDEGVHNIRETIEYMKKHPMNEEKPKSPFKMSEEEANKIVEQKKTRRLNPEKVKKFMEGFRGYAQGGEVEDEDIEGEGHSHTMRPDYEDELENEPMGNEWHSDEFLADPYGEMTSNHHVEFDPDVEEEEGPHDEMRPNPKKRLETIMARRRATSLLKK